MSQTQTTPFAIRNLSVLSYAAGFTSWHYKAGIGTLADIQQPGFFNDAADMIAPGDHMDISVSDGGCILFVDSVADGVKVRVMAST